MLRLVSVLLLAAVCAAQDQSYQVDPTYTGGHPSYVDPTYDNGVPSYTGDGTYDNYGNTGDCATVTWLLHSTYFCNQG